MSAKLPAAATAVWPTWSHRQSPEKVPGEENIHLSHGCWVSPPFFQPPFWRGSWTEKGSYVPLFTLLEG